MRRRHIILFVNFTLCGLNFIIMLMKITERKDRHIAVCLRGDVRSGVTNGFEKYRLIHNPLPEADFESFSTETEFLGKRIAAPLLISSMTCGTEEGERINRNLTEAAETLGLPFAIGSQRIFLEHPELPRIPYRKIAPSVPMLANLGAVQLNRGWSRDRFLAAVEMIEADALILHLNPLQELLQKGGDTDFSGLLGKIETLCSNFPVPVIVKEVGWGIGAEAAKRLTEAGVSMIDVAGAGGTSWSRVECQAAGTPEAAALAAPFEAWGIPTAECIAAIRMSDPSVRLIASGGIMDGVDAAKAILLGAELCGLAGRLLPSAAAENAEPLKAELNMIIRQYRIARFLSTGIEKTA